MNEPVASTTPKPSPEHNSPASQIDFVKLMVSAAEGHLRASDTKAQIALAAFVLSWNPLLSMFHSTCRQGVTPVFSWVLAASVVITILSYGNAVWPSSARREGQRSAGLFFLSRGSAATREELLGRLRTASFVEELADEALKLSDLRLRKTMRLKVALGCSVATYVIYLILLMSGRQCV